MTTGPTISLEEARRLPRIGCLPRLIIGGVVLLFCSLMLTILLALAVWPGEVKLVAPLFCPDERPDAFIVTDTYSVRPGETSTNYTLYCMGPRGDASDEGFMRPFLATWALNTLVLLALVAIAVVIGAIRRRSRRRALEEPPVVPPDDAVRPEDQPHHGPPPGSTAGPFVT